jgi:hypothetical protein
MTRETRILLVIGVLAVVGVMSLGLIADRYRRILSEAPRSSTSGEGRRPDLPLPPAAPSSEDAVTRFVAVRKEVLRAVEDHARAIEAAVDPETGVLTTKARAELEDVMLRIAERKLGMLARVGLSGGEYDEIRRSYLKWRTGSEGLEDALRRSFESRRTLLEDLELGPLEELDVPTSP